MTPRLRDVVASALEAWGCAWEEVERNLLHVEIEPGTIAETVLEATGSVHLGLVEFEEDVAAMFPCWRSCAPGSYFLHRLLEVLRGGPETGTTAVIATHQPPAAVEVMPEGGEILGSCCRYTGTPSAIDQELATTVYHFEVRLIGVDPTSEIVDVTVEPLRFNVLRSVSLGAQQVVDREPARAAEDIMDGFVLAADTVRQETNRLLERYAAEHANEAASAIRRIREAARSELDAMATAGRSAAEREETQETWRLREEDARLRARAERTEISLVAATTQWRPATLYNGVLRLPDGRSRPVSRLFDRATGWMEPHRCESCGGEADLLKPGTEGCSHLLCDDCANGSRSCAHISCPRCRPTCVVCDQEGCPVCDGCKRCGGYSCASHVVRCRHCQVLVCRSCGARCEHAQCEAPLCPLHAARYRLGDMFLCGKHAAMHRPDDEVIPSEETTAWTQDVHPRLLDIEDVECARRRLEIEGSRLYWMRRDLLDWPRSPEPWEHGAPSSMVSDTFPFNWSDSRLLIAEPLHPESKLSDRLSVNARTPEEQCIEEEMRSGIRKVLATLTPREERILRMRFGIGELSEGSLADIAEFLALSPARIKSIEEKAIRKLRHPSRSRRLRPFVD